MALEIKAFQDSVWRHYRQHGRHSAHDEQIEVAAGGEVAGKRSVERLGGQWGFDGAV